MLCLGKGGGGICWYSEVVVTTHQTHGHAFLTKSPSSLPFPSSSSSSLRIHSTFFSFKMVVSSMIPQQPIVDSLTL